MELPKNITQIGEADQHCKIYVEDYVISYMKQLNQLAMDKDMAVALYGIHKEENGVSYLFVYGAGKLTFLQKETRHLSQAQQQEIEKLRRKYFAEYSFLGYRLLNGEMLEGFHVCEQDICRYISGYAQFYEKNDRMLAYMLDERENAPVEVVDQEKYEVVRRRQEERRAAHEGRRISGEGNDERWGENRNERNCQSVSADRKVRTVREGVKADEAARESNSMRGMRAAVVGVFTLLCLVGLSALNNNGGLEKLQVAARQAMNQAMEQKIPDGTDVDTLVAEKKLTEAVLQENELAMSNAGEGMLASEDGNEVGADVQQVSSTGTAVGADDTLNEVQTEQNGIVPGKSDPDGAAVNKAPNNGGQPVEGHAAEDQATQSQPEESQPVQEQPADSQEIQEQRTDTQQTQEQSAEPGTTQDESPDQQAAEAMSYTIQEGDTLIGISVRKYGTDEKVDAICSMNQINNPNDIKIGQTILLP